MRPPPAKTPDARRPPHAGRPAHAPTVTTRREAQLLSGLGATSVEIAAVLGVSPRTLGRYYAAEVAAGLPFAKLAVTRSLYRQAVEGHVVACIFWLKSRAGWRER